MKQVIIAGGSGFLGQVLARHFERKGWDVGILTRNAGPKLEAGRPISWDGKSLGVWTDEIEKADVVINLSGKSVDCRYHKRNREQILKSRIEPTSVLSEAIRNAANPPKVWLNASSSTIYAHSISVPMDEESGETGEGFSVEVCKAWEKAFFEASLPSTRRVALRASMALGHGGNSVFPVLRRIVRFGMGGRMSSGKQMVSWIHEQDFARAVEFAIDDETIEGPLNITAPAPVSNSVFMKAFRTSLRVPFGLDHYKPLLEVAAWLMQTETELTLKSRFVYPRKLLENRFVFKYPFVDEALAELTGNEATFRSTSSEVKQVLELEAEVRRT